MAYGIYAYNKGSISDTNIISDKKLAESSENKNEIQNINSIGNEVVPTSIVNTNISPNAIIIEKRYYKDCDHLIREVVDIPQNLINKTEEDVKKSYLGWNLEGYSPTEIVLYKEFDRIL